MARLGVILMVAAVLGTMIVDESLASKKRGPRKGVFGTINGKKFSATNLEGADDPCVNGIYKPSEGIITFGALECKEKRRRQGAQKKNYKFVGGGCSNFDAAVNTLAPPYTIPCIASTYSEWKTGRFRQPLSSLTWLTSVDFTNPLLPAASLYMRIDSFDGTTVRGVMFGSFDTPQPPATGAAVISEELQFEFPFRVQ